MTGAGSFEAFVAERSTALLRTAYLLTGSRPDAEDLLQTVLTKTYLSWDRVRDSEALDGYVRRIMVNTHTSLWRRRRLREQSTDDVPEIAALGDATADADLRDALWAALAGLSRRQRAAVVLRYWEDLSEAEAAAVLGVSVGTVKSTTSRALVKLRDCAGLSEGSRFAPPAPEVSA